MLCISDNTPGGLPRVTGALHRRNGGGRQPRVVSPCQVEERGLLTEHASNRARERRNESVHVLALWCTVDALVERKSAAICDRPRIEVDAEIATAHHPSHATKQRSAKRNMRASKQRGQCITVESRSRGAGNCCRSVS